MEPNSQESPRGPNAHLLDTRTPKKDTEGPLATKDTLQSVSGQNVRVLQGRLPFSIGGTCSASVAAGNWEEMRLSRSPAPGDAQPSNWHTLPAALHRLLTLHLHY